LGKTRRERGESNQRAQAAARALKRVAEERRKPLKSRCVTVALREQAWFAWSRGAASRERVRRAALVGCSRREPEEESGGLEKSREVIGLEGTLVDERTV